MEQADKIRVMLVDDHDVLRNGLAICLEYFDDIELVGQAANGRMAVDLCPHVRPDVIVMDLVMPEMDGITATRMIREANPAISIIALTNFEDKPLIDAAIRAGISDYILKNISMDEFADTIRKAYRRPAAAG